MRRLACALAVLLSIAVAHGVRITTRAHEEPSPIEQYTEQDSKLPWSAWDGPTPVGMLKSASMPWNPALPIGFTPTVAASPYHVQTPAGALMRGYYEAQLSEFHMGEEKVVMRLTGVVGDIRNRVTQLREMVPAASGPIDMLPIAYTLNEVIQQIGFMESSFSTQPDRIDAQIKQQEAMERAVTQLKDHGELLKQKLDAFQQELAQAQTPIAPGNEGAMDTATQQQQQVDTGSTQENTGVDPNMGGVVTNEFIELEEHEGSQTEQSRAPPVTRPPLVISTQLKQAAEAALPEIVAKLTEMDEVGLEVIKRAQHVNDLLHELEEVTLVPGERAANPNDQ